MIRKNKDNLNKCSVSEFLANNNDDDDFIINDTDDDSRDFAGPDQEALGQETPIPSTSIATNPKWVQEIQMVFDTDNVSNSVVEDGSGNQEDDSNDSSNKEERG
jgi:hypothetical protein